MLRDVAVASYGRVATEDRSAVSIAEEQVAEWM